MKKMDKRKSDRWLVLEKYLFKNRKAKIGIAIILIFTIIAVLAPVIAPYGPREMNFVPWESPSPAHLLGVNSYGQDIFPRLYTGRGLQSPSDSWPVF